MAASSRPIDARQHQWWYRLRRLRWWGFTLLVGGLGAPVLTCVLFAGVVWFFRYPLDTFLYYGAILWAASMPVYLAACLWTWSHMEQRYRATLRIRCPRCGYPRTGAASRCPECGLPLASD